MERYAFGSYEMLYDPVLSSFVALKLLTERPKFPKNMLPRSLSLPAHVCGWARGPIGAAQHGGERATQRGTRASQRARAKRGRGAPGAGTRRTHHLLLFPLQLLGLYFLEPRDGRARGSRALNLGEQPRVAEGLGRLVERLERLHAPRQGLDVPRLRLKCARAVVDDGVPLTELDVARCPVAMIHGLLLRAGVARRGMRGREGAAGRRADAPHAMRSIAPPPRAAPTLSPQCTRRPRAASRLRSNASCQEPWRPAP